MTSPLSYGRVWLAALLGFLLLGAGWGLATPYDGAPDEKDHVLRAYGVVTGQILLPPADAVQGGGAFVRAPRSLDADRCWQFHPERSAACAGSPGPDRTVTTLATSAGRNTPLYYALVGPPLVAWPDWTGVLLARLLSAGVCALLLATALADAVRWSRHRPMAAGVLAATTPMVAHLAGSVNPSALELAASIAFFAAAVPLLLHPAATRDRALLHHAGLAALALTGTRMLGPLWLGLAVVALLLGTRRDRLRDLWAWPALRWWVLAVAAAIAAGTAWTALSRGADANPYFQPGQHFSPLTIVWTELQSWPRYVQEMVGVTSWLDARMPALGYLIWPLVGGALVLWGYLAADRADRRRIVALTAAAVLAPLAISVALVNTFGFITQGRYLLPLLSGLPILATFVLGRDGLGADRAGTLRHLVVVALLPLHLAALAATMQRWQLGQGARAGFNLLDSPWQPPLGPVVPLVAALVGVALLGRLVWTGAGVAAPRARAERAPRRAPVRRKRGRHRLVPAGS